MHRTLTPQFNLVYIGLCLLALLLAIFLCSWRESLSLIGITLPLGALAGILRARALDIRQAEFMQAKTTIEVRRALVASLSGTVSIVLLRATFVISLFWIVDSHTQSRFILWLAGFASFSFARGLFALPALLRLNRFQPEDTKRR
jgi:hypothetical protein